MNAKRKVSALNKEQIAFIKGCSTLQKAVWRLTYLDPLKAFENKISINKLKKSSDNNDFENNISESNPNTGTNVFNPYENNTNEKSDETTILKQNTQNNSDSIDLTKNVYSKEENDSTKKDNKEKNENDEEEELPLLEELGINPQSILNKIIGVITLKRIDKKFVEDTDMGGPLLIFLIFAFSLVLQYKTCFVFDWFKLILI